MKKLTLLLFIIALLAAMPASAAKYIAIVETEVDGASGAAALVNPAEVREITAELRRQATQTLPAGKYNVITTETVLSMGGAVLEECSDENCVVTLGSKIGADFIVRGTVSKFQTKLTLAIELYETENGTLVLSSNAVRSENLEELLKMAGEASAEMYRKFAGTQNTQKETAGDVARESESAETKTEAAAIAQKSKSVTIKDRKLDYYIAPKYQFPVGTPVMWGGFNLEGGLVWGGGAFLGLDINYGKKNDNFDMDAPDNDYDYGEMYGGGLSLGNVYVFGTNMQLVYGMSAGCWYSNGFMIREQRQQQRHKSEFEENYNYLGPFVKLRWRFIEITYRGLLGTYIKRGYDSYSNKDYYNYNDGVFGWNNHQLMLGLYFATSKRTRK